MITLEEQAKAQGALYVAGHLYDPVFDKQDPAIVLRVFKDGFEAGARRRLTASELRAATKAFLDKLSEDWEAEVCIKAAFASVDIEVEAK